MKGKTLTVSALVLGVAAAGCSDGTAPQPDLVCPSASVPLCTRSDSVGVVILPAANDARTRSVSALKNVAQAARLATELSRISEALKAGNVTLVKGGLRAAREVLVAARQQLGSYPGDAPDLAAVELALIQIERAVK